MTGGQRRVRRTHQLLALQLGIDGNEIVLGQHHVGIEYEHIFALGTLHTVVAALTWSAVGLGKVVKIECAGVFVAHVTAWYCRTVLNYYNLKIGQRLPREAIEQLVNFIRTIVYWNYKTELHGLREK